MKMTISKKERDLLIGFFGVLIAVAVWLLVASPYLDKKSALESENAVLREKVTEYEAVNARVNEYSEGIINYQVEIDDILSHYPGEIRTEDQVMFWANIAATYPLQISFQDMEMEELDAVVVEGVTDMGDATVTYDEDGNPVVSDSDVASMESKYVLYGAPMQMEFRCTYAGLKNMLNYISGQYDRTEILATEVEYDEETGLLIGLVGIEQYFIEGTDKAYEPTFIPSVPTGQNDVFHTVSENLDTLVSTLTGENGEETTEGTSDSGADGAGENSASAN